VETKGNVVVAHLPVRHEQSENLLVHLIHYDEAYPPDMADIISFRFIMISDEYAENAIFFG
jgi:hypothetical protein